MPELLKDFFLELRRKAASGVRENADRFEKFIDSNLLVVVLNGD